MVDPKIHDSQCKNCEVKGGVTCIGDQNEYHRSLVLQGSSDLLISGELYSLTVPTVTLSK